MRTASVRTLRATVVVLALALVGAACGDDNGDGAPGLTAEQREDPQLVTGEEVYSAQCTSCHGADGGGRAGNPSLVGVEDRYSLDEQVSLIERGRGGMPSFSGRLSDDEIESVARYEREVL